MPSLSDSWSVGTLELHNRIVVSSMCQYMAQGDGRVTDWHMVHYGSLALGGAALTMVEASAVEARGFISTRDLGLYDSQQVEGLSRIVSFAHQHGTKMGIQLAHAGRKADVPEPIVAPSALAFNDRYQTPRALQEGEIAEIVERFAAAAKRAVEAGFDVLEIHAAHGYLLHQFLSPFSNKREDRYGGDFEGRIRLTLEVIAAVRATVSSSVPVGVRISATDYHADGYDGHEAARFSKRFADAGAAFIDVSSGGNTPVPPHVYPGYQVPLAALVKAQVSVPVIAVGMLDDPLLAEHVIQSGQADAVAIARGFLRDPHWGHKALQTLGHPVTPPTPYARAYM
ncbi:MAG: NADH:flavin oxidoreductase/NADH oxidase [Firmicutes bacterium]|nr:NADH:flavin oxidoreductase/NADH oxidase [Bacillota bacterium]